MMVVNEPQTHTARLRRQCWKPSSLEDGAVGMAGSGTDGPRFCGVGMRRTGDMQEASYDAASGSGRRRLIPVPMLPVCWQHVCARQRLADLPEPLCIRFVARLGCNFCRSDLFAARLEQAERTVIATAGGIRRCRGVERWQRAVEVGIQERADKGAREPAGGAAECRAIVAEQIRI